MNAQDRLTFAVTFFVVFCSLLLVYWFYDFVVNT
jgi:hypothetical protein